MTQNYSLIRLCADTNEANKNYENILEQLPNVANNINIFTDPDECVDFLTDLEDIKAILIIDDTIGQQTTPLIHDVPQLDHIYLFSHSKSPHSEWLNEWPKVKDIHTTIIAECEASEMAVKQDNHDSIAVSFVPINGSDLSQTRHELEPSFMYTQILKEIVLEMKYDQKSIENFVTFCRSRNDELPNDIDQFEKEYHNKSPIHWYTRLSFIYPTLNSALRELNADVIIKMGFFIFELHNQIKQRHSEQLNGYNGKPFIVYRGQALLKTDFEKLLKTKGGLMSFNNFLSTSRDEDSALCFARTDVSRTNEIGILFVMTIDPLMLSSPFAHIQDISQFTDENEVLFSMHTVFRVGEIKPINNDTLLYQAQLELTGDDDEQLRILTKHIENDSRSDAGWKRLGNLLFKIDQFDKVEELYIALLEQTPSDHDRMYYYNQLLNLKYNQGAYEAATEYYLKMIEIHKKTLPENNSLLSTSDNNIVYFSCNIGEYSRTHVFYKKSPSIDEENLPVNHLSSNTCHNNTAGVDDSKRQHSKTLFFEKALESYQRVLAPDHPRLATSYNNSTAGIFEGLEENLKVLLFNEKLLESRQKILPANHPDLAISYYSIAAMYRSKEEHSKALSFYENSLKILQKTLPVNHPHLAVVYNEMGLVYKDMEEYSKALLFCKTALEIRQRSLPANHSDLTASYINIASIYYKMAKYIKVVFFYEKAVPKNHPWLPFYYHLIGSAYYNLEEYSKALSVHEKSLEILEKTPAANRQELAASYNVIGSVYFKMAEYTKALNFHEKALEIHQEILPPNYHGLMAACNNIGSVYCSIGDYSKALSYFKLAFNISKISPTADDSNMTSLQQNIAFVEEKLMI